MCGRAAVIRAGAGMARAVGARRIIAPGGGGGGGRAGRGAAGGGGGGAFRDAGGAPGARIVWDDAAAPAAAETDAAAAAGGAGATATDSAFPDVIKAKEHIAQSHASKQLSTITPQTQTKESTSTQLDSRLINFNCGPTSIVPVWRLQTAEEQRELLALDKAVESKSNDSAAEQSKVKAELDVLAADAIKAEATHTALQSVPVIQYMQWGFVNPLAGRKGDDGPIRSHVFNARSESVDEKRMFKELVHKKRGVVLVDGFYEWHTEYSNQTGDVLKKQGYFFHMPLSSGAAPAISIKKQSQTAESPFPVMHLAALYDAAINDETGETIYNVVVLTCGPSKEMSKIHTRMPVILSADDARRWVDVDKCSWKDVKPLCKPFEGLGFYAVPAVVNNARNHGIECIEPLDAYNARLKAGGIAKFFSPVSKSPKQMTQSSSAAAPTPSSSFFNPHGSPGKTFPSASSHVNPADIGQTGEGSKESAAGASSTETSDAAEAAESFVLQHKHDSTGSAASAGSKRKQPAESTATASSSSTLPLPLEDESEYFDMDDQSMPFVALSPVAPTSNAEEANKKARIKEEHTAGGL